MEAAKLMAYDIPGDQKVPVTVRDWNAQKLALWRSRGFSEIAVREALEIVERCKHKEGCPGAESETEPCIAPSYVKSDASEVLVEGCPDREQRMSALVLLNAARQLAPTDARRPADERFFAPSREYYSEVMAALGASQIENEMLRALLAEAGIAAPEPMATSGNSNEGEPSSEPPQLESPKEEADT
jgi:hypothetical protein